MNIDHSAEFGRRLMTLAELFDVKLSPQRAALYFEALRDLPFEVVAGALNHAAKTCTFFPRPAELRNFGVGDSEDVAERAWLGFRRAMGAAGHMASIVVEDAALGETILAMFGSWSGACASEFSPEMWTAKRKEFGRIYRVMRGRALSGSRYLVGVAEAHNQGHADWMRFVPGACIGSTGEVAHLSAAALEAHREQLAVTSHAFSQLDASLVARSLPPLLQKEA